MLPLLPSLSLSARKTPKLLIIFFVFCFALFHASVQANETESKRGEFLGAMETVYPDWFKVSFLELEEDVAEAAANGKRLMLLFHQDSCPYCNAFVERNLTQKDIEMTLKEKFDVIELNMWGDREMVSVEGETYTEKEFAKAVSVQFTPTILFLTEEGNLSLRLNGYLNPDRFRLALQYVSDKMESKESFTDFVTSRSDEPSSKTLIVRDYFTGPITKFVERPDNASKPLLLMFEQGSCRNCETLHDRVLSLQVSQELLKRFDVYRIDMWGRSTFKTPAGDETTGRELSNELDVSYAPTMIFYSADGAEVIRSEAYFKTFHTQSIMDYVASGAWRTQSSFQRYIAERADILREQGINVDIWD
ncbi:MAG: thioredoxin fold domain-containing protein [Granulosicoccaceae bacterium]